MTSRTSVTFCGKEAQKPCTAKVDGAGAILINFVAVALSILWLLIIFSLFVISSPVLLPMHYVLVACGRQGFVYHSPDTFKIRVSKEAFRRA